MNLNYIIFNELPLNLNSKRLKKLSIDLINNKKVKFDSKEKSHQLLSSSFTSHNFSKFVELKNNHLSLRNKNISTFTQNHLNKLSKYLNNQLRESSNKHIIFIKDKKYSRAEIVYMMHRNFSSLSFQGWYFNFSELNDNEMVWLNNIGKDENNDGKYVTKIENQRLICYMKRSFNKEKIELLKSNKILIHNFIRNIDYSKKIDGDRFLYLGKTKKYKFEILENEIYKVEFNLK